MRKFILALALCFVNCTSLLANRGTVVVPLPCTSDPWPSSSNFEIDLGYRRDELKWSIANTFTDPKGKVVNFPNVLSELQWKELNIAQIAGTFGYVSDCNYAIKINADYGHIFHGKNIDSDYHKDNKRGLWSRSQNNAGKGNVCDISGAVGYKCTSSLGRCVVTPLIGYSYQNQNLHVYDGVQTVCIDFSLIDEGFVHCATGPFPGLDSKYTARWFGPWVGMDFGVRVEQCAYMFGGLEWHLSSYRGYGKWNLRPELGPFHHKAHGHGWIATLGGKWEVWRDWDIGIVGHYRDFRTNHGRETYTINVDGITVYGETRFNHASWISWDLSFIFAWRY